MLANLKRDSEVPPPLGHAQTSGDPPPVHGRILSLGEIERLLALFRETDSAGRAELPGLSASRADVIIAGTLVVLETMRRYGREELIVSERGIRHAVLSEALAG